MTTTEPSQSELDGGDLFRRFVNAADDLMTVVDRKGRFVFVNPSSRRFFGLAPESCLGRLAFDFVHPDDRERTWAAFEEWISGERPARRSFHYENRQLHTDGAVRDVHWTITRVTSEEGRVEYLASTARDVSAAKRAERAWMESETRLRAVLQGMHDAVITIDAFGVVQECSDSVRKMFGYAPEMLVGKNISLLMPEPHRSMHDDYLAHYRETGETWILDTTREFRVMRRDGTSITCELSVSRADVPDEEPCFVGSFRDVTERRRVELALRENERRFRALFDQEFQMVGVLRPDGTVVELNTTALRVTGVPREQAIGLPFWSLPSVKEVPATSSAMRASIDSASEGRTVRLELELRPEGQGARSVDFSVKPLRDPDGDVEALIIEGRDVTEMKDAQRRETAVLRAFASIGENAAALAHEIKNPITSVNLALRAVAKNLGEDEQHVLEQLVGRMQRLERMLRRTLSLAKPIDVEREPVDMEALARQVVEDVAEQLERRGVSVDVRVGDGTPPVDGDAELLGEVLTNLVVNACEAVDDGGRIQISIDPAAGRRVLVRVDDDGPGIPDSIAARLFEPYATSKEHGTGLGLALTRKIVEAHGGRIRAGRAELGGARFELDVRGAAAD